MHEWSLNTSCLSEQAFGTKSTATTQSFGALRGADQPIWALRTVFVRPLESFASLLHDLLTCPDCVKTPQMF